MFILSQGKSTIHHRKGAEAHIPELSGMVGQLGRELRRSTQKVLQRLVLDLGSLNWEPQMTSWALQLLEEGEMQSG